MLVVSDTNIFRLFPDTIIYIPPTVHQELQIGLEKGKTYLNLVLLYESKTT
jgi:mannose-6-phosphate isomerase-like protein (cupin superfamily)